MVRMVSRLWLGSLLIAFALACAGGASGERLQGSWAGNDGGKLVFTDATMKQIYPDNPAAPEMPFDVVASNADHIVIQPFMDFNGNKMAMDKQQIAFVGDATIEVKNLKSGEVIGTFSRQN